jgi:hypothetical protein
MMARARLFAEDYRSLALLLLLVGAVSATAIMSCGGGGGGGSDGGLCSQCGVSPDGPCQSEVFVGPGPDADALCPEAQRATGCTVTLTCLRKVDSAQRRCFPFDANPQFKCDGSRAGGTAVPEPTITPTGTPGTPTVTVTASPGPNCGNGVVDTGEDCDGINLDDMTCEDLCTDGAGALGCTSVCTFDFSACEQPSTCS